MIDVSPITHGEKSSKTTCREIEAFEGSLEREAQSLRTNHQDSSEHLLQNQRISNGSRTTNERTLAKSQLKPTYEAQQEDSPIQIASAAGQQ